MAARNDTGGPFEHERYIGEQYQLIPYLSRSAYGLWGMALLVLVSAVMGSSIGGNPLISVAVAVVVALVGFGSHSYASRLDERRRALKEGTLPPEIG